MFNARQFSEKYQLALQSAKREKTFSGLCGFELEWNLIDSEFRPMQMVRFGDQDYSFVDFLRAECINPKIRPLSQLEVFHWMIEWATRPFYNLHGAVYEAWLMEAVLNNALFEAESRLHQKIFYWHGNLLSRTEVDRHSIPLSWHLAKRRYLERCVDLYGYELATAGTHTNLSLPEPLLAWDFMHLTSTERGRMHLDEFKSEFYITATRLMRAFACLFIATSASTPLIAEYSDNQPVIKLTEMDSVRNLTFPNPFAIDLPGLYRSYEDYLHLSYDLVHRGIRFGNNNWTPVRARSFAEPVERLIEVTSDQLRDLYERGLYSGSAVEEIARQIEIQNLMARINLPMARVEVRTDDGGNPVELDIANLTLKHLLLLHFYADPDFARAFRYDKEDIHRARGNEERAARDGMRAEINNPLTGKPVGMRDFLAWTLSEVRILAEVLGFWEDLQPLVDLSRGAPNTSELLRTELRTEFGINEVVPYEVMRELAGRRTKQVALVTESAIENSAIFNEEAQKIGDFAQHAREAASINPMMPIQFRSQRHAVVSLAYPDKTTEILDLAQQLIRIPSVTACPEERLVQVRQAASLIYDYFKDNNLEIQYFDGKYPALFAGFAGQKDAPVTLSGHFDVVAPEPDDSQFEPRIEGDYLLGRGSADMKTVVATYLVWMKDQKVNGPPFPPVNILLVGNEENGETEAMGTPHVLESLKGSGYEPNLLIAGERTGEKGNELWGEICIQNRGVMRAEITLRGIKGHSGLSAVKGDLTEQLLFARNRIQEIAEKLLTLKSSDGWQSQYRIPFIQVGVLGVYNITPDRATLGLEIRPIPQDDLDKLKQAFIELSSELNLEIDIQVMEKGIACDPENVHLKKLIEAVRHESGMEPRLGRKLPGTSARFAPLGQGIVWGQSGIGPHAKDERHFIPSILPYYRALSKFGQLLVDQASVE